MLPEVPLCDTRVVYCYPPMFNKINSLSCLADDARKAKTARFFRRVKPRQSVEKKRMILETRSINIVIHFDRFVSNTITRKLS